MLNYGLKNCPKYATSGVSGREELCMCTAYQCGQEKWMEEQLD
jgi:hypothetical protein